MNHRDRDRMAEYSVRGCMESIPGDMSICCEMENKESLTTHMHALPQLRASSTAATSGTGTGIGAAAADRDTARDGKYWNARHRDEANSLQMMVRLMMAFEYISNDEQEDIKWGLCGGKTIRMIDYGQPTTWLVYMCQDGVRALRFQVQTEGRIWQSERNNGFETVHFKILACAVVINMSSRVCTCATIIKYIVYPLSNRQPLN